MFPWQMPLPLSFTCPYCGEERQIKGDTLVVCDCPESREKEAEDRENRLKRLGQHDQWADRIREANEARRRKR
jgi:hypothetical protein